MSNRFSFAAGSNADFLDTLYLNFQNDPASVDETWRKFFEGFEFGSKRSDSDMTSDKALGLFKVQKLIETYRRLGHRSADLNPLAPKPALKQELSLKSFGLEGLDKKTVFAPLDFGHGEMSLEDIESRLQRTYTGSIGAEFTAIENPEALSWLTQKLESLEGRPSLSAKQRIWALGKVAHAEGFEKFLHTRFVGQKRFSVEGLEALLPLIDTLCDATAREGAEEVAIGMAHRGRLNVLINIMGKPFEKLVKEFEGSPWSGAVEGDVKYHLGYASTYKTFSGKSLKTYLAANPSHLEAVNPVLEGYARSRQNAIEDHSRKKLVPFLLHGDAAFIGQGVVAETLNMSHLKSYTTGGTIHIITNNMIGFTTEPEDSRSTMYSSDLARMLKIPILHVNADDVDAVIWVGEIAGEYRQKFGTDVLIDLVGYRRHGHNEGEEPSFTQPLLYKTIANHPTLFTLYSQKLVKDKVVTEAEAKAIFDATRDQLQAGLDKAKDPSFKLAAMKWPKGFEQLMESSPVDEKSIFESIKTQVTESSLKEAIKGLTSLPAGFNLHPKAKKVVDSRSSMLDHDGSVDWATGELLALATLAKEGHPIRFSGQDVKRGTFTSRHSVFFDYESGRDLEVLNQLGGAKVDIVNSPLSEAACIGFEWGYSHSSPNSLVVWEAQFGDFSNGGQIHIDQYLVSSEAKWKQTSGLVLLLPHGYEGQGPEHSNARPERFLQLCGAHNITVAIPSTPAQHFHLLRRQVHRGFRKPLVIMSPKSLLRDPEVISKSAEFTSGSFLPLLDDPQNLAKAKGMIFCTGKIYYDLKRELDSLGQTADVAIVRVEQLYPFDLESAKAILAKHKSVKKFVWAQEEPLNMGAWTYIKDHLEFATGEKVIPVSRPSSGTTAEGSNKAHQAEQSRILKTAIAQASGSTK